MADDVRITGGHKLRRHLKDQEGWPRARGVRVGFFESARYEAGQAVAEVAFYNEFGTGRIPERPFLRISKEEAVPVVREILKGSRAKDLVRGGRKHFEEKMGHVGAQVAAIVQKNITVLRTPPNAPGTIKRKGSSNPLIDTGFLRQSVSWHTE